MRRFQEMRVHTYVIKEEAYSDPDGGIVDVRWVTVNKGTRDDPNVRCRLVARGFAEKGNRDDLFAGTPPLVSVRVLLSLLAMKRPLSTDFGAMVADVKCAFFYGRTKRSIYIWLPPEDPEYSIGSLGKLEKSMYGARDAPQVWQDEVRSTMKDMQLLGCSTQPGIYYSSARS